jgi:hypothetical protein
MGIFGKKKKEIKETTTAPTEDEVTSSVMPTQITKEKTHQPAKTQTSEPPQQISAAEEERLHYLEEVVTDLNRVHALPPDSITQMGEIPNLLFAIYTELREIRKILEKATENEE